MQVTKNCTLHGSLCIMWPTKLQDHVSIRVKFYSSCVVGFFVMCFNQQYSQHRTCIMAGCLVNPRWYMYEHTMSLV